MKRMNAKEVLVPAVALFLICLIVTALLAGTNSLTEGTIAEQAAQKEAASRQVVLPGAETFEEGKTGAQVYYTGKDSSGGVVGYVFTTSAKGYGGQVEVMTGISAGGEVTGVVLLSQEETPGLGANATKEEFRNQYLQNAPQGGFAVTKTAPAGEGEIVAMTGATITSQAVTDAVNAAVSAYQEIGGKGGDN